MMAFLFYIGKVAILLAVFYLFYRLLMERETFHRLNRAVLLMSALASFILPTCIITMHQVVNVSVLEVSQQQIATTAIKTSPQVYWPIVILFVYLVGLLVKLLHTVFSTIKLHRFISHLEQHPQADGIMIAVSNQDITPFSWWNTIVLSRSDFEASDPALIAHEKAHVQGYHTVDILLMEMLLSVQWFNPAAWLMSRDLRAIHEYEADSSVLAHGIDPHHYLTMLMERSTSQIQYSLANSISQKTLKSRFIMMSRKDSNTSHIFRVLYVLPIIGCTLALNARTVVETHFISKSHTIKSTVKEHMNQHSVGRQVDVKVKEDNTISDVNDNYQLKASDGETLVRTETTLSQFENTDNNVVMLQSPPEEEQQHAIGVDVADDIISSQVPTSVHISGIVVDEQGEPVIGAVIKVHGHTLGAVSDFDGEFSIPVPQGSTLEVMYIGYGTESFICQEDMSNLKVTLIKDNSD